MLSRTKLGLWTLFIIGFLLLFSHFLGSRFHLPQSSVFGLKFDVNSYNIPQSSALKKIIENDLAGQKGDYAVYIEDLTDSER